jgi:Tfp pilus assembly protein PilF
MDRVMMFRSFIERTPTDPFPRYGLAMELVGRGDRAAAATEFATLIEQFPDYVPAYLMAGNNFAALAQNDRARDTYRDGIEVATRKGDSHARGELESALSALNEKQEGES